MSRSRELVASEVIRCPAEAVFEYVADFRNAAPLLEGVARWEPVGVLERGVGARYQVEIRILGMTIGAVLRLTRWERPRAIGFRSESAPVALRGNWTLTAGEDECEVELRIDYRPPGGPMGSLIAIAVEGVARQRLMHALAEMKAELEAGDHGLTRNPRQGAD